VSNAPDYYRLTFDPRVVFRNIGEYLDRGGTFAAVASIAALCLLGDFPLSDILGFALAAAVVLWQWRQRPRNAVAAA